MTGSQSHTTFVLALIRETFGVDTDQTAVNRDGRLVVLHTPDGVPDIVQQVAHGVENLLSGYRIAGHSFYGIIESTIDQYVHLGDACTITDNRIYDPSLAPEEVAGDRSGRMDDRWVFTGRDTAREYGVITALAAASRVLRGYEEELARECLETAVAAWDREQAAKSPAGPAFVPEADASTYPDVQEIVATIELLITTGYAGYREHLLGLLPTIETSITHVAWAVVRALPWVEDRDFECRVEDALKAMPAPELAGSPYGVPYEPAVWGIGWGIQHYALERYFLTKAYPDMFNREDILRVVNYVLGCHPGSDVSFVSGVGARSLTVAYGTNRADWFYIPGGVASGTNLVRPDFPELKEPFPFLWQQAEYVIGGAATYIFCILAADDLLNGRQRGERQVHTQSRGQ